MFVARARADALAIEDDLDDNKISICLEATDLITQVPRTCFPERGLYKIPAARGYLCAHKRARNKTSSFGTCECMKDECN